MGVLIYEGSGYLGVKAGVPFALKLGPLRSFIGFPSVSVPHSPGFRGDTNPQLTALGSAGVSTPSGML